MLVPIGQLHPYRENPREGDVGAIAASLATHGQYRPIVVNRGHQAAVQDEILAGNHTWLGAEANGWTHVAATWVDVDDDAAARIVLVDNRLADQATYNYQTLANVLAELGASPRGFEGTGYTGEDLDELLADLRKANTPTDESWKEAAGDDQLAEVDLIYTANTSPGSTTVLAHCCIALRSGWLYGFRSSDGPCGAARVWEKHRPVFIDNDYHDYDHDHHVAQVAAWQPRYATTRDVLTKAQAEKEGITYLPIGQILEQAAEVAEAGAENVIVIPKTKQGFDKIPDEYMLGFSVPTSYGGTNLPPEAFKGRRVHLLGGSPKAQLQVWQQLRDEVVSIDSNYLLKTCQYASAFHASGETRNLADFNINPGDVSNPMYVALTIGLGSLAAWFGRGGDGLEGTTLPDADG